MALHEGNQANNVYKERVDSFPTKVTVLFMGKKNKPLKASLARFVHNAYLPLTGSTENMRLSSDKP